MQVKNDNNGNIKSTKLGKKPSKYNSLERKHQGVLEKKLFFISSLSGTKGNHHCDAVSSFVSSNRFKYTKQ